MQSKIANISYRDSTSWTIVGHFRDFLGDARVSYPDSTTVSSSPLYFSPVAEAKGERSLFGTYPAETNDRAHKVGSKKHRVPSLKLIYVTIIFNNAKKVRTIQSRVMGNFLRVVSF